MKEQKLNSFASKLVRIGINPYEGQIIEIFASAMELEFTNMVKNICLKLGAGDVFITDYSKPLDITEYQKLMNLGFARITLFSPFLGALPKINENLRLYFSTNQSQWCFTCIPNDIWAKELNMSKEELWNLIIEESFKEDSVDIVRDKLNSLKLEQLILQDSEGTNLCVGLTNDFIFQAREFVSKKNIKFYPNIPSNEIFTSPSKYEVNGTINIRNATYKNKIISNFILNIKDGYIQDCPQIQDILELDDGSRYIGEVALVENNAFTNKLYLSTLLDEAGSCHIALGRAYCLGIKELNKINLSKVHLDLILDNYKINVYGIKGNKKIMIIENGAYNEELYR